MNDTSAPMSLAPPLAEPAGTNLWLHLVTLASITIVSITASVVLVHEFGFDPPAAVAIGCCLFLIGSSAHLVLNRTARSSLHPVVPRGSVNARAKSSVGAAAVARSQSAPNNRLTDVTSAGEVETKQGPTAGQLDEHASIAAAMATIHLGDQAVASSQWANDLAAGLAQSEATVANPPPEPRAETEFERVERLVKRLADNVNQVEAARINVHPADAFDHSAPSAFQNATEEPLQYALFPHSNESDRQLANSIHALRATSGLGPSASQTLASLPAERRNFSLPSQRNVAPLIVEPKYSAPPLLPPFTAPIVPAQGNITDGSELGAILEALAAHRIDVALEPILDLTAQRPEHYEVSIALRDQNAQLINLADIASDLSGTGALPLIDSARLVQAAQMARRLADKGRRGTVLAELNAESLSDANFETATRSEVGAFDGQIVLTLSQAQAHSFTYADWATLARLRASGLAFALADVTTLDMDFASLANAGFVFAKLDAQTFLSGLPIETTIVPPADICGYLAQSGLTVIVQGIAAGDQLAQVHACGVHLGQGQVFGGARQMKTAGAPPAQVAAE